MDFNPFPNPFDNTPPFLPGGKYSIAPSNTDLSPVVVTAQRMSSPDLSPIVVTAQKMNLPLDVSPFAEWFKPPKLFITLGIGAAAVYFLTRKKR